MRGCRETDASFRARSLYDSPMRFVLPVVWALTLSGCPQPLLTPPVDGGPSDVGGDTPAVDTGPRDSGRLDGGDIDGGDLDAGDLDAGGLDVGLDTPSDAGSDAGGADAGPIVPVTTTPTAPPTVAKKI